MLTLKVKKIEQILPDNNEMLVSLGPLDYEDMDMMLEYINGRGQTERIVNFLDAETVLETLVKIHGKEKFYQMAEEILLR